jgi:hypothetical protein
MKRVAHIQRLRIRYEHGYTLVKATRIMGQTEIKMEINGLG